MKPPNVSSHPSRVNRDRDTIILRSFFWSRSFFVLVLEEEEAECKLLDHGWGSV